MRFVIAADSALSLRETITSNARPRSLFTRGRGSSPTTHSVKVRRSASSSNKICTARALQWRSLGIVDHQSCDQTMGVFAALGAVHEKQVIHRKLRRIFCCEPFAAKPFKNSSQDFSAKNCFLTCCFFAGKSTLNDAVDYHSDEQNREPAKQTRPFGRKLQRFKDLFAKATATDKGDDHDHG